MKSTTSRLSVGIVGFLEGERATRFEPAHADVGFPEKPLKPDKEPDKTPDISPSGDRPTEACRWCRGREFWRKTGGPWVCERCHPPVENPAERYTLPGVEGADMSQSKVVEARFRPTVELVYPQPGPAIRPVNPEFPRCPECNVARYWIAPTGKVICGSCGQVRFILAAIEYHSVQ